MKHNFQLRKKMRFLIRKIILVRTEHVLFPFCYTTLIYDIFYFQAFPMETNGTNKFNDSWTCYFGLMTQGAMGLSRQNHLTKLTCQWQKEKDRGEKEKQIRLAMFNQIFGARNDKQRNPTGNVRVQAQRRYYLDKIKADVRATTITIRSYRNTIPLLWFRKVILVYLTEHSLLINYIEIFKE